MPRKGPVPKRQLAVDPVFNSPIVTQLINKVLLDGKKTVAEGIVYGALEGASEKNGQDPVVTLKKALDNIRDRKSTRLNSSHVAISYAVFCLKKKNKKK